MTALSYKERTSEAYLDYVDAVANNHEYYPEVELPNAGVLKERARVLRAINELTGLQFHVVSEMEGAENVAAFIETDSKKVHIRETVLDDLRLAMYAAKHEKTHYDVENFDLNQVFELEMNHEDKADLAQALDVTHSQVTAWDKVEGFTDLLVAKENESAHREFSGYEEEVDFAQRLDELALKLTGVRISTTFKLEGSVAVVAHMMDVLTEVRSGAVDSGWSYGKAA